MQPSGFDFFGSTGGLTYFLLVKPASPRDGSPAKKSLVRAVKPVPTFMAVKERALPWRIHRASRNTGCGADFSPWPWSELRLFCKPAGAAAVGSPTRLTGLAARSLNRALLPTSISFAAPRLDPPQFAVGEAEGSIQVGVTCAGLPSGGSASVDFATSDGTAAAGTDYEAASGTLNFSGNGTANATVTINDNHLDGGDCYFQMTLSNPTSSNDVAGIVGSPTGTVYILDEENGGDDSFIEFSDPIYYIPQGSGTAYIPLIRNYASTGGASAGVNDLGDDNGYNLANNESSMEVDFATGQGVSYAAIDTTSDWDESGNSFNLSLSTADDETDTLQYVTVTIVIEGDYDTPAVTPQINGPGDQTVSEHNSTPINGISVDDSNSSAVVNVGFSVSRGELSVTPAAGTHLTIPNNDSGFVTVTGSVGDINSTFDSSDNPNGLQYQGYAFDTGSDTLIVSAFDDTYSTSADDATVSIDVIGATEFGVALSPTSSTAGNTVTATVTAENEFGTVGEYTGSVHFTSSDSQAALPSNATLTDGVGTFDVTLKTAALDTVTATDSVSSSITGSGTVSVTPGSASHLGVAAPSSVVGGAAFPITVDALDTYNNVATGFTSTVHITSTDSGATLPVDAALSDGVGTFYLNLMTLSTETVSATDTASSSISGSATVSVTVGPFNHFAIMVPSSTTAVLAINYSVTADGCLWPYAHGLRRQRPLQRQQSPSRAAFQLGAHRRIRRL